jgi:flagellin-like hook-associated protein FlgL
MEITDTQMTSMSNLLRRARDLAVEGDTDTLSVTQKKYIADEIEQLTLQMVTLVNARYKGDYIFSGSHTDKPPIVLKESKSTSDAQNQYKMAFFNSDSIAMGAPIQIFDPNGGRGGSGGFNPLGDLNPVNRIIPRSLEIYVFDTYLGEEVKMEEGIDYEVNYVDGTITLIDEEKKYVPDTARPHPLFDRDFSPTNPPPAAGVGDYGDLRINLTYMDKSKDVYGDPIDPVRTNSKIYRQIEEGIAVPINTTLYDLTVNSENDVFTSLINLGEALIKNDHKSVLDAMGELDASINKILSAQSTGGSIVNRFNLTLERNEIQQTEVTRLQSQLEDADYATALTNYMVKETIFNTALNSTARIMQLSLADYLR